MSYESALWIYGMSLQGGASGNIRLIESSNPSPSPISALSELLKPKEDRNFYQDIEFFEEDYQKFYLGMSEKKRAMLALWHVLVNMKKILK